MCVFFQFWLQRRGATLAPLELSTHLTLLGLQVKAEYTFLCTSPTHSASIFVDSSSLFSSHASPCWSIVFFFLFVNVQTVYFPSFLTFSAPGCRIFQWNRMFPPFQLPVDNHSVSFTDASFFSFELRPVSVGTSAPFPVFCWSFFLPQCHLTSHHVDLHVFSWELFREPVCLSMWQWMMNWINCGGKKLGKTPLRIFHLKLSLFLCEQLQDRALVSVSPVVFPLQSVPWGSSTLGRMLKRLLLMPWYENPSQQHHINKKTHGKLSLCVTHSSRSVYLRACLCVCVW